MKILQVVPYFPPAEAFGGPSKVAYQVSRELVKSKNEVVVYTSDAKDFGSRLIFDSDVVIDGIRVHYFKNLTLMPVKKFKFFITPQLVSHAKEEVRKFDVIHLHEYRTFQNIVMAHYAKKYGVPYVLQSHGSLSRIVAKQRLKWIYDVLFGYNLLKDASRVIALSQMEAEQCRNVGVPDEKIAVIPNGIDLLEYAELPPKGSFKRKFGIPKDKKIILYLGRVHKTKGIDFLVKAYARLVNEMEVSDTFLAIAGPDDGYLKEAKFLVNFFELDDKVLFTGMLSKDDKISGYIDSSIVVNVEPRNVFGLVPLEAAACSTPVIVSKGNAMNETICEGKFGFSVKYSDINELAETMSTMLDNDGLLREMGEKGRKFVFENYDWANIVTKFKEVYKEAISTRMKFVK